MTHLDETTLNDYADDRLPPPAGDAVEAHLEQCNDCRRRVRRIRQLRSEARGLAREIPPGRDLWPGVEARIREGHLRREPGAKERPPFVPAPAFRLLQAAVLTLLVAAGAWYAVSGPAAPRPSVATGNGEVSPGEIHLAALEELDREYDQAAAELRAVLEAGEGRLAPETMEVLDENLRIIEAAIRESREALERDPAAPAVLANLRAMYEMKLDVLRRAVWMSDA